MDDTEEIMDDSEEILETVDYNGTTYIVGYEAGLIYFKPIDSSIDFDDTLGTL